MSASATANAKAPPAGKKHKHHGATATVASPPGAGDDPTRNDILAGLSRVQGKIQDCYDELQTPGLLLVKMVVLSSGKVQSVVAEGALAGTPSAECVEQAVKGAWFRPFKRDKLTLTSQLVLKKLDDDAQ